FRSITSAATADRHAVVRRELLVRVGERDSVSLDAIGVDTDRGYRCTFRNFDSNRLVEGDRLRRVHDRCTRDAHLPVALLARCTPPRTRRTGIRCLRIRPAAAAPCHRSWSPREQQLILVRVGARYDLLVRLTRQRSLESTPAHTGILQQGALRHSR